MTVHEGGGAFGAVNCIQYPGEGGTIVPLIFPVHPGLASFKVHSIGKLDLAGRLTNEVFIHPQTGRRVVQIAIGLISQTVFHAGAGVVANFVTTRVRRGRMTIEYSKQLLVFCQPLRSLVARSQRPLQR